MSFNVGFVSDLEGGWEAWRAYLRTSSVFSYDEAAHSMELKEGCMFVFGGDTCDRGCGDIRILQDLLSLKRSNPDRVFFIIGNRDANKLRLPFALHEKVVAQKASAYWIPATAGSEEGTQLDRVNRLKWVLKYTMGAPFAFECRREELVALGRDHSDDAVAQSFLDLVTPGHPDSLLLQYLENAQMSVIIEDTIFVHGGISDSSLGFVPPRLRAGKASPAEYVTEDVYDWTKRINEFARDEVEQYKLQLLPYLAKLSSSEITTASAASLLWDIGGSYEHAQPGSRLVQCGMGVLPGNVENPGVIYNSYLNRGEPVAFGERSATWLKNRGINKIVVGHQPNGDAPFIMDQLGIQAVSADTSYSKGVLYRKRDLYRSPLYTAFGGSPKDCSEDVYCTIPDFVKEEIDATVAHSVMPSPMLPTAAQANTRNLLAVSEVCIRFPSAPAIFANTTSNHGILHIHGRLAQASSYSFTMLPSAENRKVGKKTPQGWFVKAGGIMIGSEEFWLLAHSKGFDFKCQLVAANELDQLSLQ